MFESFSEYIIKYLFFRFGVMLESHNKLVFKFPKEKLASNFGLLDKFLLLILGFTVI